MHPFIPKSEFARIFWLKLHMAPLSPRKTAVAAGVTEQGTAVLEVAAQVLALGGRFSAWKMLVQVNAADTCISARCIFC